MAHKGERRTCKRSPFAFRQERSASLHQMNRDTKPYDTAFKDLAEQSPELLLRLVGALPPDATVTVLPREVSTPMLATDQPYEIVSPTEHFIAHLEEQTRWEADVPQRVARYQVILWANYQQPVRTYVLLLTRRGWPTEPLTPYTIQAGDLAVQSSLTVVKCWELSATDALAQGNPNLLPFIALMDGGQTELEQAARALGRMDDEARKLQLAAHFVVNGGLRYNREYIFDLLGRLTMIPIQALRESSVYQFILEEGREKGLEQGLEQGKRNTLKELLQRVAQNRFPGFAVGEDVERIHDLNALEDLCVNLYTLPDEAALQAQLQALAVNGKQNGQASTSGN